jgi:Zn-dependent M16 (insulinase) family peptidase
MEVFRREFSEPGNIHSKLQNNGVVYNEETNTHDSPDSIFYLELKKAVLSDTHHCNSSWGVPIAMTTLSVEDLRDNIRNSIS